MSRGAKGGEREGVARLAVSNGTEPVVLVRGFCPFGNLGMM